MNNKRKKRKLNKKRIIFLVLFTILIIIIVYMFFSKPKNRNLKNKGYSNLEIVEIEKLTKSEINTILKYDYDKNLIYIIKSENYNPNKLDMYLKYTLKYKDVDYLKIFELINNENFVNKNIDDYVNLLKKYNNVESIIKYINNYNDSDVDLNEDILSIIGEKYFIDDYFDRYVNYYNKNKNLPLSEIITRVNAKLDYTFYDDSKEADLSKDMYTLVNKFYYLAENYIPDELVDVTGIYARDKAQLKKIAFENFVKMADDAKKDGLTIKVTTGYRSYNFQSILYNNYVKIDGVKNADTYSARPGYSEHQLGYSVDITNKNNVSFDEFENTDEYNWLQKNAYKYGFIQRYPKDKEYITGYVFESWHYRYVGEDIAKYIYENNITYEEYYEYFLR